MTVEQYLFGDRWFAAVESKLCLGSLGQAFHSLPHHSKSMSPSLVDNWSRRHRFDDEMM
jgi:hypothetical protein